MTNIVIAYDGSDYAETIFTELQRAGLPAEVKAHVVAVTDSWAIPLSARGGEASELHAAEEDRAEQGADALAEQGAARVRELFPAWEVVAIGTVGSAARSIVRQAAEASAELIFIGSHSRSAVGRFFLGSVSQKVASEAACSVHICRPNTPKSPALRLVVAVDGSEASENAVAAVAKRSWPAGTAVAAVNVLQPPRADVSHLPPADAAEIERQFDARLNWLNAVLGSAQKEFEKSGLAAETHLLDGEPKSTLQEWSENWGADCLFIGASGLHHAGSPALGTVASALAARAHCSVEIVRPSASRP